MLRNMLLSVLAAGLVLASGAAAATQRTFEATGTVDYTSDAALAPIGSKVKIRFSYDDAMVGDYIQDWYAYYGLTTFLSGSVNGHGLLSDTASVTVYDTIDAQDLVDVNSNYGIMLDDTFHQDGFFGFRLLGDANANTSRSLPSSYDVGRYGMERYGYVFLDLAGNQLVNFSVDSIVPVETCVKKNGKPFKHCRR
jgi:hypothetical protein